jgi:hypothetical protein
MSIPARSRIGAVRSRAAGSSLLNDHYRRIDQVNCLPFYLPQPEANQWDVGEADSAIDRDPAHEFRMDELALTARTSQTPFILSTPLPRSTGDSMSDLFENVITSGSGYSGRSATTSIRCTKLSRASSQSPIAWSTSLIAVARCFRVATNDYFGLARSAPSCTFFNPAGRREWIFETITST